MYTLRNVSKSYSGYKVLDDISISLPRYGFVAILGKSGSGKSTLLNILMGLDSPTKGNVTYLNKDIHKLKNAKLKYYQNNEIGMLFQHFNLFDELTSLENVILPKLINGSSYLDAKNKGEELFKKYHLEYLKDQSFITLSGGEKERVALLRALINNPKVILADEPTGALDSKNARFILNELKALAKDHLVIVVTHNEELIKEYEDIRLTLIKGKIKYCYYKKSEEEFDFKRKRSNLRILKTFIQLHLKKHLVRNIIASSATMFSSLCLIISLGYIKGSEISINKYKRESLLYNYSSIAKKSVIDVPNSPIKLYKLTRPEEEELEYFKNEIPSIHFANNYETIFPSNITFIFDNKTHDDIEFKPVYDFLTYSSLLIEGRMPNNDINEVVVNEEFINHFSYKKEDIINHTFTLSYVSFINNKNFYGEVIKDEVIFSNTIKIVGVIKEFAYLNSSRIYYPYLGLDNYLENIILPNYSKELGFDINIKELVCYASKDDANSAYSYLAFVDDLNDVDKLFKLKEKCDKNNTYDITSTAYTITSSYISMNDVIKTSLIVFIVLLGVATLFILIITAYSNFTQNKKESAMLSVLGSKRMIIFNIYNFENILVALFGLIIAFVLLIPIKKLVNYLILKAFNLSDLIVFSFLSPLTLFLIIAVILIASLSTFIPFMFYERGYVLEEIKDE